MAQNNFLNNHRLSSYNQISQDNYEYDLMKLIEQERQLIVNQTQRRNIISKPKQQNQYIEEIYPNINQQPLKIIIIRHAERVDAVLGSDWSKKSFDRSGRYIRFNEHLPDA